LHENLVVQCRLNDIIFQSGDMPADRDWQATVNGFALPPLAWLTTTLSRG
jgi:hypothetical protein